MAFTEFPTRFGKYIVLDRVSSGGMAEVYRAKELRESGFSRVVAIKHLSSSVDAAQDLEPMFVDEAKLTSRLMHPNIAQTFELGRIDGGLYIAMELVWGRDLRAIIKACEAARRRIPTGLVCYFIAKAAEAVDYVHNAVSPDGRPMRIVHRDLSPRNVLVSHAGEIKIIDFGIAKAVDRLSKTQAGIIKGNFSYMAPEQARGAAVDRRTDIYTLGILLYEMLSGERLYDGTSAYSIYDKVMNHRPRPVRELVEIPIELDAVVSRCLAKNPAERFQSAAQLADALAPFRISERTIVGAREAAAFLRELFPDDDDEMREKMRSDQAVHAGDCADGSNGAHYTQVLVKSDFTPNHLAVRAASERKNSWLVPPANITPITIPMTKVPAEPYPAWQLTAQATQIVRLRRISRSTMILIAMITAMAAAIIITARIRNETAIELFESIWRETVFASPGQQTPSAAPERP